MHYDFRAVGGRLAVGGSPAPWRSLEDVEAEVGDRQTRRPGPLKRPAVIFRQPDEKANENDRPSEERVDENDRGAVQTRGGEVLKMSTSRGTSLRSTFEGLGRELEPAMWMPKSVKVSASKKRK